MGRRTVDVESKRRTLLGQIGAIRQEAKFAWTKGWSVDRMQKWETSARERIREKTIRLRRLRELEVKRADRERKRAAKLAAKVAAETAT